MEKAEFDIGKYVNTLFPVQGKNDYIIAKNDMVEFQELCQSIDKELGLLEESETQQQTTLIRQKNALLGKEKEIDYYMVKIKDIIKNKSLTQQWYPCWYESLPDAIYQETRGFAGLNEWIKGTREELKDSSSAKIIGNRIFFRIDGVPVLQQQTISSERRKQLKNALLLSDPKKKSSDAQHEVYLLDGTRVKIYSDDKLTKKEQDCFIFRKFIVKDFTMEKQVELHTIPPEAPDIFKAMIKIGYNVAFVGSPGSAKTTFLTTWENYESNSLEGVQIETDPEIPWHILKPGAPIIELVPDERNFKTIIKDIMRSDPDYIIMAEARDAVALYTAVDAANRGTRRVKMTYHTTDMIDFCYDVACRITMEYGGDLASTIIRVAKSFNYILQFTSLAPDKSRKRLKALWEVRYDPQSARITMHQICKYRYDTDDWVWNYDVGTDKEEIGKEENMEALEYFKCELKRLAKKYPMDGNNTYIPSYDHLFRRDKPL